MPFRYCHQEWNCGPFTAVWVAAFIFLFSPPPAAAVGPDFQRVIQPILNEHCVACHGGVKKSSGFSVLSRQMMLAPSDSGQPGLVPGDAGGSAMIQRIVSRDPDERMPPEGHDPLDDQDIQLLKEWVVSGAEWPSH